MVIPSRLPYLKFLRNSIDAGCLLYFSCYSWLFLTIRSPAPALILTRIVLFLAHEFYRVAKSCWTQCLPSIMWMSFSFYLSEYMFISICYCYCHCCTGILFVELNSSVFVILRLLPSLPAILISNYCCVANALSMHFGNWFSSCNIIHYTWASLKLSSKIYAMANI